SNYRGGDRRKPGGEQHGESPQECRRRRPVAHAVCAATGRAPDYATRPLAGAAGGGGSWHSWTLPDPAAPCPQSGVTIPCSVAVGASCVAEPAPTSICGAWRRTSSIVVMPWTIRLAPETRIGRMPW